MLDLNFVRDNLELVKQKMRERGLGEESAVLNPLTARGANFFWRRKRARRGATRFPTKLRR